MRKDGVHHEKFARKTDTYAYPYVDNGFYCYGRTPVHSDVYQQ